MATVTAQSETRSVDRVLAHTRDAIFPEVKDQAFNHSPGAAIFFGKLMGSFGRAAMSGAGLRTQRGVESIVVRLNLGKGEARTMVGPWGDHGTAPSDTVRFARHNWKHLSANITLSDTDLLINTGPEAIGSLVAHETQLAMNSLVDLAIGQVYDNAGVANALDDLDTMIGANNSWGGISGATYAPWNSRGLSDRGTAASAVSFTATAGGFAATGLADMLKAYNNASEGSYQPTVILTDYLSYQRYESALTPQQVGEYGGTADASFSMLKFKQRPMLADDKCPANSMFFLNVGDEGVQFVALEGAVFEPQPFKRALDSEARVSEIQFKGNLVSHSRRYCNKITGLSD